MKLLKFKQDRRSLAFTFGCLFLLLVPFSINITIEFIPFWLLVSSFFCFIACIVNHNHVHNSLFRNDALNILFGFILTLCRGHTSAGIIIAHNYNHHIYNGKQEDWIRPGLAGNGPGVVRLVKFIYKAMVTMAKGRRYIDLACVPDNIIIKKRWEQTVLLLFGAILLYIDSITFFIFVLTPWLIGVLLLIGVNLLQHDNCKANSKYNHSRNFTSRMGNWLLFNNGYHTAHHMKPEAHWSLLPALHHKEITPYIDRRLNQPSIFLFLISNYLTIRSQTQGEED